MAPPSFNVVVVGAGIFGIAAAKFYLQVHPDCRLVILEKEKCIGAVWSSREDSYTACALGMAEFCDKPMKTPPSEDTYYDFFKSKYTTQYLEEYVNTTQFAGKTLRDRIRFDTKVCDIQKLEGGWRIYCEDDDDQERIFHASKLIIASGLTSIPRILELPNREAFERPVIDQEEFERSSILSSEDVTNVVVIGGAQSAADMVYDSVQKATKSVSWIIRSTDIGPGLYFSPRGKGPYKNASALASTRAASSMTPSIYSSTLMTKFLHSSEVGQRLVHIIRGSFDKEIPQEVNHDTLDSLKGIEKLSPKTPIFLQNESGGLLSKPDFFNVIKDKVKIYHDDILELDKGLVRLNSGEEIPADALLCGIGWTSSLDFFHPKLRYTLGIPSPIEVAPAEDTEKWMTLESAADASVLKRFPQLRNPPDHDHKPVDSTPYRLYNGIAPLRDDSIVFVGHVFVGNYFRGAEVQAIWATAYLDKNLELPPLADREAAVAQFRAWCRRRYPSNGELANWLAFESLSYTDKLLQEVGLSSHRKGWINDRFVPCTARDLEGLRDEYIAKFPTLGIK